MSNALSRLRALFGDELFVRSPQEMRPTPRALELAVPIGDYQPSRAAMKRLRPLIATLKAGDRPLVRARFTSVTRQPAGA